MNTVDFIEVIIYLIAGIVVFGLLGNLTNSRFTRTTHRDEFKNKKEIGKQNLGKIQEQKTYREIAKTRQLEEAKNLEHKLNPKVTRSLAMTTKDIRKKKDH